MFLEKQKNSSFKEEEINVALKIKKCNIMQKLVTRNQFKIKILMNYKKLNT